MEYRRACTSAIQMDTSWKYITTTLQRNSYDSPTPTLGWTSSSLLKMIQAWPMCWPRCGTKRAISDALMSDQLSNNLARGFYPSQNSVFFAVRSERSRVSGEVEERIFGQLCSLRLCFATLRPNGSP